MKEKRRNKKEKIRISSFALIAILMFLASGLTFGCQKTKTVKDDFMENAGLQKYRSALYEVSFTENRITTDKFVYGKSSKNFQMWNGVCHFVNLIAEKEGKAEIRLKDGKIETYKISPENIDFKPQLKNGVLTVALKQKEQVWLEINGDNLRPLFIFANPPAPEVPQGAVYFAPGIHNIGMNYKAKSNTVYYLDDGAYLIGSIDARETDNVTVMGCGVLSGEFITLAEVVTKTGNSADWAAYNEYFLIRGSHEFYTSYAGNRASTNLMLQGITLIDAAAYTNHCINGFDNVKIISPWAYCGLGPFVIPQKETPGVVKNCFVFAGDDVIFPETNAYGNVEVSDCIVSTTNNSVFLLGYWGFGMEHNYTTTVKNVYVRQPLMKAASHAGAIFQMVLDGYTPETGFKNVYFEDIYIEGNILVPLIWFENRQYPWPEQGHGILLGNAFDITFKNITVAGTPGRELVKSKIFGLDSKNGFKDITIENLNINGTKVTNANMPDYIQTNEFAAVTVK